MRKNLIISQDYQWQIYIELLVIDLMIKKLTIDSSLEDEKIDTLFEGFTLLYCKIEIETIEPQMKI